MSKKYISLLSIVNGTPKTMVIDLPVPSNISYLWNFGFTLAFVLAVQIVTGIFFLAMHYSALLTGGVMYMHSYLYGDLLLLLSNITYNSDVAEALHLGFQDPAIMEEIVNFHHYVMVYLTFILFGMSYLLWERLRSKKIYMELKNDIPLYKKEKQMSGSKTKTFLSTWKKICECFLALWPAFVSIVMCLLTQQSDAVECAIWDDISLHEIPKIVSANITDLPPIEEGIEEEEEETDLPLDASASGPGDKLPEDLGKDDAEAPKDPAPAPKDPAPAPKQDSPAPKQGSSGPKQDSSVPKQDSSGPKKDSSGPKGPLSDEDLLRRLLADEAWYEANNLNDPQEELRPKKDLNEHDSRRRALANQAWKKKFEFNIADRKGASGNIADLKGASGPKQDPEANASNGMWKEDLRDLRRRALVNSFDWHSYRPQYTYPYVPSEQDIAFWGEVERVSGRWGYGPRNAVEVARFHNSLRHLLGPFWEGEMYGDPFDDLDPRPQPFADPNDPAGPVNQPQPDQNDPGSPDPNDPGSPDPNDVEYWGYEEEGYEYRGESPSLSPLNYPASPSPPNSPATDESLPSSPATDESLPSSPAPADPNNAPPKEDPKPPGDDGRSAKRRRLNSAK